MAPRSLRRRAGAPRFIQLAADPSVRTKMVDPVLEYGTERHEDQGCLQSQELPHRIEQKEGKIPTPLADMEDTRAIGLGTMAEMMSG